MPANEARKRVLMLVAQDPALDPRIDWSATFASKEFDVSVIGVTSEGESSHVEAHARYPVRQYTLAPSPRALATFTVLVFTELSFLQRVAFLAATPALIAAFFALGIAHRFSWRMGTSGVRIVSLIRENWPVRLRARRFRSLLFSLYHHFSPVTSTFLTAIDESGAYPDIVHCNDLDTLLVGVKLKKKYGCRVVYDAHEYWPFSDPHFARFETRFYTFYEGLLVGQADRVITVNPYLASRLVADYALQDVTSVPNAVPLTARKTSTRFVASLDTLAAGRMKFLYQGGFAAHRGIEELLLAWKDVDSRRAALFLRGPDNANKQQHHDLADELGLLNRSVYFIDAVNSDELVDAAREADVGVIPYRPTILNHVYSCPNKLSQYLQAGIMILADSNLLYINQIVNESQAGVLYDSNIAGNLLSAINLILNDSALVGQCKNNALIFFESHFNWNNFFGSLREVYAALAKD